MNICDNIIKKKQKPTSFMALECLESSALLNAMLFKIEELKDNFIISNIVDPLSQFLVMYEIEYDNKNIYYKSCNDYISDLSGYLVNDLNTVLKSFILTKTFPKNLDYQWEIGTEKYTKSNINNHIFKSHYANNVLHREDGPAIEYSNGDKEYYINGQRHRENGPAIDYHDKYKEISKAYYLNGILHRSDGPAIEYVDGLKQYYVNGKLHRIDGPAIESDSINTYFLCGVKYSYKDWLKYRKLIIFL